MNIFKWNGEYFGFVRRDYLFSHRGEYRGWIGRNQRVWKSSGEFLGELVDGKYILRRNTMIPPVPTVPKVPPVPPRSAHESDKPESDPISLDTELA